MLHATCKSPTLTNIRVNVIQFCAVTNLSSTSKKTPMKQVQGGSCNGTCQQNVIKCSNVVIFVAVKLKTEMMDKTSANTYSFNFNHKDLTCTI